MWLAFWLSRRCLLTCVCRCACLFVNKRKSLQLVSVDCCLSPSIVAFVKKIIRRDCSEKPTETVIETKIFFCLHMSIGFSSSQWLFKCPTFIERKKRYSGSRTAFINSFININKPLSVRCKAAAAATSATACVIFYH